LHSNNLASVFEKMIAGLNGEPPTDERPAQTMHAQWLAFRKVQSKVIIEAASKDLLGIYMVDFDALFHGLLSANIDPKVVNAVLPEPSSLEREREQVVKQLATLEDLLKAF
jgi:hypothetical protein